MATSTKSSKTTKKKKPTTKVTSIDRSHRAASPVRVGRVAAPTIRSQVWTIGNLLALSIFLYVGLALVIGLFMQPVSEAVTITHLTNDALLSQQNTVFITAHRALFDIELRWMLVALLLLSAVVPLLYLTKLKDYYAEHIARRRVIAVRWLELGVTSALIIETIALLSGINDLMTLKLLAGSMVATCLLGWLAERQNEKAARPVWSAYAISVFTGVLPWVVIGVTKVATMWYGGVRSPWYVYVACVFALVGFCFLGLTQLNQHRRKGSLSNYALVERNYQSINLLTRVGFAAALFIGLVK